MRTLYLNPNKGEKEESFLKTFLSARGDLHIEGYDRGESPDYILYVSQKRIGLEVTTLVLNKSGLVLNKPGKTTSLAAIRNAQNKCLKKAAQIAERDGLETVRVEVKFRSVDAPIDDDIDKAAKELIDFVKKKTPTIDDTKSWHFYELGLKYSDWISIHLGTVNGHEWLLHHRFERIHINWMTIDPIDEIQSRINEKQLKFCKYIQKCHECWLLIGVDEWTAPEAVAITEKTENHAFSGDFKRLFFLRGIEGTVKELKISHKC